MSFTLGLYDLFANTIPGFIYLFILNETLRELGFAHFNVTQIDHVPFFLLLTLLAYLVGHIMDYLAYRLWVRVFYPDYPEGRAYEHFRSMYPELKIQFNPSQSRLLFAAIKFLKPEIANDIEKNKVISLMLRNVSFAFVIFFLSQVYIFLFKGNSLINLSIAVASLLASIITLRRAELFHVHYYKLVFEHIVLLGDNLEEVINYNRKIPSENKSRDGTIRKSGKRKNDSQ